MANFNKVFLMGNLTKNVEVKDIGDNKVAKFSMAMNRKFKNSKSNETVEETTFVDCEAWGNTAKIIGERFSKGKPIFVEGRLRLDKWEDKETKTPRSKLMVVVTDFSFVDKATGEKNDNTQNDESIKESLESVPF